MESKFSKTYGVWLDILASVIPIVGAYAAKGNPYIIGMCAVVAIVTTLSAYGRGAKRAQEEESTKPNYHTTKDNVQKIEIIEYTCDDEINSTTYVRDQAYLSGFKKVR